MYAYKSLARKPEGKRPLGKTRHRWENNIKMDLRETEYEGMGQIHLVQFMYDLVVGFFENVNKH
jgi:hypothetical protein